jgi:hypothetical protein
MQLGVKREFWTKFQEFLKSLTASNKIQKISIAFNSQNFNSDSVSNLRELQ